MGNTHKEGVLCVEPHLVVGKGSAGLKTQIYGASATVTNLAEATGGIGSGYMVEKETN